MQNWKISEDEIKKIIADSKEEVFEPEGSSYTIVSWTLPNGYTIEAGSGCINPKQYDRELGIKYCREHLTTKLWELEGYHRKYLYNEYVESHSRKKD